MAEYCTSELQRADKYRPEPQNVSLNPKNDLKPKLDPKLKLDLKNYVIIVRLVKIKQHC